MMTALAVETRNLTRKFGDFCAVDNLDLKIKQGEIYGLLGPNGAGKTTSIRMLCGILLPSSGEGRVLGYDIAAQPEMIKKSIGYMSQQFSLYNDLTAMENMRFYAQIYGLAPRDIEERLRELVDLAGINGMENQVTADLSGAWRQRLALACAIVHKPPMLFLDEPTAGVDPASRKEFWDLIYTMAEQGVTVLATTHYMDEAEYCQTIGMMYRSRLIMQNSPQKLKNTLRETILEIACDQPNRAAGLLAEVEGVRDVTPYGLLLHVMVRPANGTVKKNVIKHLKNQGVQVEQIDEIQPNLEDIFLRTISEFEKKEIHQA